MSDTFSTGKKKVIMISGPTASGKSDLALQLALHFQSDIFSADSRQLYIEMNIGTAKPEPDSIKLVPHHFINHTSIFEPYSVGTYVEELKEKLSVYFKSKSTAILVGGTGLYIKALVHGLDDLPPTDSEIIQDLNKNYEKFGIEYLSNRLKELDTDYYQVVDRQNPHRLMRALSVCISEKKPYSSFLGKKQNPLPYDVQGIILLPERKHLYKKIETRVDFMVENGLEEEAKNLYAHKNLQALQTVGYQEFFKYFDGECSREVAIDEIKKNSRRYAKRQTTWLHKYGVGKAFASWDFGQVLAYLEEIG